MSRVVAVFTGKLGKKEWTLAAYVGKDRFHGTPVVCAFNVIGPVPSGAGGGGGCAPIQGVSVAGLKEPPKTGGGKPLEFTFVSGGDGMFGAVAGNVARLQLVDVNGKRVDVHLLTAPPALRVNVRFFALPSGDGYPVYLVARDSRGRVVAREPA